MSRRAMVGAEGTEPAPALDRTISLGFEVDPVLTLGPLRHGPHDPTVRFERGVVWRALRTAAGPASLRLSPSREGWRVMAWGTGAERAFAALPRLLGSEDDPAALRLPPGPLHELLRRFTG